jgi:hypothetical protein
MERDDSLLEHVQTGAVYAPHMLEQHILVAGRSLLGLFTILGQLVLRSDLGTRAIHPITYVVGAGLFQSAVIVAYFLPGTAPLDMWTLWLLFMALTLAHAARLRPVFLDQRKEKDSEYEGTPWRFFFRLPYATDTTVRCLYEPAAVVLIPWVLCLLHLLSPAATIYCAVTGLALALRTMLREYERWVFLRISRDTMFRAEVYQEVIDGTASPEDIQIATHSGHPADPVVQKIEATLEPEFAGIKTVRPTTA